MDNEIGKIKSLALRDFLTYNELKYVPGKYLNIIIGPNGTGKSTIVAGIILGCGGKPQVLSRSKDIGDYVKNGKTRAHIEIELIKNKKGDIITLHRTFDKAGKESFTIDGNKASSKAYVDRVRSFNIQVDNLCIFLPQDRVQDFTKMNPQELLNNTQISVCSQEINDAFDTLKEKRNLQKNATKTNTELQVQLEDNVNRNNQLHGMIENNRLKEELIEQIDLFQKKKAWCEFDDLKAKYDDVENDVKKLQESIAAKKKILAPLEKRQNDISGTKNELKNSISKANTKLTQVMEEIEKMMETSDSLETDIAAAKQNLKNVIARAKNQDNEMNELGIRISFAKKEYEEAQKLLQANGNYDDMIKKFDRDISNYRGNIDQLMNKINSITNNLDEQLIPTINATKRKIDIMSDTQHQRFNILRNNFEDAYRAYEWLSANRQSFRGHIYNPVITEITLKDKKYAKYVENCIGLRDLEAFVCTDKQDMQRLIMKFRNEMRLKVNIAFTEQVDELLYESDIPIEEIPQNLGLYAYVVDLIEGPTPILNHLCSLYRLHNTAIGDDRTYKFASQLPESISVFFSTNHRFQATTSKYSGKKSVQSSEVQARNILNVGIDQGTLDREKAALEKLLERQKAMQQSRLQFQQQIVSIEENVGEVRLQKNEVLAKVRKVKEILDRVKKLESDQAKLQHTKIVISEERQKHKNNVDKLIENMLSSNTNVVKALGKYKEHYVMRALTKKKLQVFDNSTGNVDEQIEGLKREIMQISDTQSRAKYTSETCKQKMKNKERDALQLTEGQRPSDPKFKYHKKFIQIPNIITEINDKIDEMQGRVECIRSLDQHVVDEYEQRKNTIEALRNRLVAESDRAAELENELKLLHDKWYPEIQRITESINKNFSEFFSKMGFVGEVELIHKEERDYSDYGIQIRVQYRDNEKLQALNRHVQSGGERAVAIAVYTLSLQHLTMVPFRCVDEINQGMDPKNERKIFQMLVDITCQKGQSQYFFVTPKLLPDLPFNELMSVSVVHNGKYIDDPYVFMKDGENAEEIEESD